MALDLGLSKKVSIILATRLNEKNLVEKGAKVSYVRSKKVHFCSTFVVYCHNLQGLLKELGVPIYHSTEWRLLIDSSKERLKCVLLHNGNLYDAVPIGHSVCLREEYGNIRTIIELLQYNKHNWIICVDLKMVVFLLGQQRGYTKYPRFLCRWDSRAPEKHWVEMNWPPRSDLKPGDPNILHEPFVDRKKIIFPRLHIKLSLMKQFVKALSTVGVCCKYIILAFPRLRTEKIKAGVLDDSQIRQLIKDKHIIWTISEL